MKLAVLKALQRRLNMSSGPGEFLVRQAGCLVSCLAVVVAASLFVGFVIVRFTRGSIRAEALGSGLPLDPTLIGGVSLLFIAILVAAAWQEGVGSPGHEPSLSGCSSLATVYFGGAILLGVKSWFPKKAPLTAGQLSLATIVVAHLMDNPDTPLEGLRQGILGRSQNWTENDFDITISLLLVRNLVQAAPHLKVDSQFKAEIRHLAG